MIFFVCDWCKNKFEVHLTKWASNRFSLDAISKTKKYDWKPTEFESFTILPDSPCDACQLKATAAYDNALERIKNE